MALERVRLSNMRSQWVIPLLLFPVIFGVGIFAYIPAFEAIRHSFYNWDGMFTEEYTGLENFRMIMGNLSLWKPFLLGAVLVGLGTILDTFKYRKVLRMAGVLSLMYAGILCFLDLKALVALPEGQVGRISFSDLNSIWITLSLGAACLIGQFLMPAGQSGKRRKTLSFFAYVLPILAILSYLVTYHAGGGDKLLWKSFHLILVLLVATLFTMWPSIFTAVCIHRLKSDRWQYIYRVLFVIPMIIPHIVGLLIWKFFYDPSVGILNQFLIGSGLDHVLIWFDANVLHLGVFQEPFKPAWLGDERLIVTSLVMWGFPWVGVVGVLIYLAGLQNIGNDIYEAAELDGVGWWGKFWNIELPLIMTQVRLNMILMVIGTFQAYGHQLILLGAEGGPGNKGLTPGLYMYFQAFQEQQYGYACAIGLILFFIILILTVVNQKYVRVSK